MNKNYRNEKYSHWNKNTEDELQRRRELMNRKANLGKLHRKQERERERRRRRRKRREVWQIKVGRTIISLGFPSGSNSKEFTYSAGDLGLIHGLGRCLAEGNGYPLQYSCLEKSTDRGVWQATVHGVTKSWTWLSDYTFTFIISLVTVARGWKQPRHPSMNERIN